MRIALTHLFLLCLAALSFAPAFAQTVDSTAAEAAYQSGDYTGARAQYEALIEQFRTQKKDSYDYLVYREAAFLYDRLADCCFTERDWEGLRLYTDGLLVVISSERNLAEAQLTGALTGGTAPATVKYLMERVEESVRIASIIQLKRSLALLLFDTNGEGELGELAIRNYQELAALMSKILVTSKGAYELDIAMLDANLGKFETVFAEVTSAADLEALWEKYPPGGEPEAQAGAASDPAAAEGAAAPAP